MIAAGKDHPKSYPKNGLDLAFLITLKVLENERSSEMTKCADVMELFRITKLKSNRRTAEGP